MTVNVPTTVAEQTDRIVIITVDCLRWDYFAEYARLYPDGVWYKGTSQATFTPASHASMFTSLNPPATGIWSFGQRLEKDNLLSNTDAVSGSGLTGGDDLEEGDIEPMLHVDVFNRVLNFRYWEDEWNWEKVENMIREHDVTFLHDWAVHASGGTHAQEVPWESKGIQSTTTKQAREAYEHHIGVSLGDHEQFLRKLKESGLYDGTLFVIWGDHGQAFGEPPTESFEHSGTPTEYEARVPIGFCHPAMDATKVDGRTNARGIDIVPTLLTLMDEAGIDHEPFDHQLQGVDLTSFDGSLYGYSIGSKSAGSVGSMADAVSTADHWYIREDYRRLFTVTDGEMVEDRDESVETELDAYAKSVRENRSEAAEQAERPTELLEDLGYI